MRTHPVLVAAALLLAPLAQAADLAKIERKIAKEPAYQTKTPKYCLLVFGLDAKTRVWLVQDGDTLYVDRRGNGDLTGDGNRVQVKQQADSFRAFEPEVIDHDTAGIVVGESQRNRAADPLPCSRHQSDPSFQIENVRGQVISS